MPLRDKAQSVSFIAICPPEIDIDLLRTGGQDLIQHWHTRPLLKSVGRYKIKRIIHVNTMARYVSVPFFLSAHSLLTDFCLLVALKYLTFELISAYIRGFATFFVNKKEKHSYPFWRQSSAFGGLECACCYFCLFWFLNYFLLFSQCVKGFFWDFTLGGELWAKCQATTALSRTLFKQWIQRI